MPIETPGITGELVWSDRFKSDVAYYPPECLPSSYTSYYSMFAWQPATQPYSSIYWGTPLAAGLVAGIFPFGLISGDIKRWTTTHRQIFAQCQYRINYPLVITKEMISSGVLALPEHIFEILSVTKEKIPLPPWIKPIPEYTINLYGMSDSYIFTIIMSLVWESEVQWKIDIQWAKNSDLSATSMFGVVSLKDNVISIRPFDLGLGVLTIKATATNSMGSHSRDIKITVMQDPKSTTQVSEKSSDEVLPTKERLEDMLWRQLFDKKQDLDNPALGGNLFKEIVSNVGIYYRMDNGKDKALEIVKQSGLVTYGYSHNDASSREIKLTSFANIKANDVLYINYVAAKEHYLRQIATATWVAIDAGYLGYVSYPTTLSAANYRFYKWEVDDKTSPTKKREVEGWRIVESFNYYPHLVGFINEELPVLANFIQGKSGLQTRSVAYMPPDMDYAQVVESYESNPIVSVYPVLPTELSDDAAYELMEFPPKNTDAPAWYDSYISDLGFASYSDLVSHLVYNVHPELLRWRDVDKYAYPIGLAETLQQAISEGQNTFVPTTPNPEYSEYLSAENFKIAPIDSVPRKISLSNASAISSPTGFFPGAGTGYTYGQFVSNLIREPFKRGTKLLVETHPLGNRGSVVLSVKCKGGGIGFVNCVKDENSRVLFVFSNNVDGYLTDINLQYGLLEQDSQKLLFDPLSGGINYEDINANAVDISKFDEVVGFSGLTGDSPGIQPGKVVSFYMYTDEKAFKEYYIGKPQTIYDSKREIGFSIAGTKVILQFGEFVYTGTFSVNVGVSVNLKVPYQEGIRNIISSAISSITGSEVTVLFGSGNSVESSIDRIAVSRAVERDTKEETKTVGIHKVYEYTTTIEQNVAADYYWLKGESLIFNLPWLDKINSVLSEKTAIQSITLTPAISQAVIIGIKDEYAQDFLVKKSDPTAYEAGVKIWTGSMFIKADTAASHVDGMGNIYVIFPDQSGNLSCSVSSDGGTTWNLQYALVPKMEYKNQDASMNYPFCLRSHIRQELFLFFTRNKVLYINVIPLGDINFDDAFIIKDYPRTDTKTLSSTDSFFNRVRMSNTLVVAGNNDEENLKFIDAFEKYSLGAETIFTNVDFNTPYFSAYQNNEGELRVVFPDDSGNLQCHYSSDNGLSWNDLWVCMKYGIDGLTAQLDNFGKSGSAYQLGFNVHSSAQDVITESPYAYYHKKGKLNIFYVYKDCLLVKEVEDPISCQSTTWSKNNYDKLVVDVHGTSASFIDGDASRIQDELDKTIIMKHKYAISEFNSSRQVIAQRIHATEMSNGALKLFYKTSDGKIRCATNSVDSWEIDDMMHVQK